MDKQPLLWLACILAGFALLNLPLGGFFSPLSPLVTLIGILTILLFSVVLIVQGLLNLVGKKRRY